MAGGTETTIKAAAALALGVSLLFSGGAAAQVYKCKGDYGRVVYSDARCGTSEERTDVDVRDNVIETSMDVERVQRQLAQQEREAAAAERQRLKEEKQRRAIQRSAGKEAQSDEKAQPDNSTMERMMRRREARLRRIERQRDARLGK